MKNRFLTFKEGTKVLRKCRMVKRKSILTYLQRARAYIYRQRYRERTFSKISTVWVYCRDVTLWRLYTHPSILLCNMGRVSGRKGSVSKCVCVLLGLPRHPSVWRIYWPTAPCFDRMRRSPSILWSGYAPPWSRRYDLRIGSARSTHRPPFRQRFAYRSGGSMRAYV